MRNNGRKNVEKRAESRRTGNQGSRPREAPKVKKEA